LFFAQFNLSAPHSSRQSDTDTVSDRFFARSWAPLLSGTRQTASRGHHRRRARLLALRGRRPRTFL